ncbi:armadillo-type protein [Tribonema minus]|uniref:Armadillo-type protein n=1 Tax=Tribonema minus TaxID=303371 RepID=A0A836CEB7_9STRA|nr:armadillo-type protein [Tribonema minus]
MTADMSSGIHLLDGLLADLQDAVVVGPFTSLMDILKRLELLLSGDAGAAADLELQPDFMINEQQAELLSTLLAAATLHPFEAHGDSHAAVLRVVQAAAASTHCPTFRASCAKMLQAESKRCMDGRTCVRIMAFALAYCAPVMKAMESWAAPDWLLATAAAQAACLDALAAGGDRSKQMLKKGTQLLVAVIRHRPADLGPYYIDAFGKQGGQAYGLVALGVAAEACATLCTGVFSGESGVKRTALQVYVRDVVGGKGAPAPHVSGAWRPFLRRCDREDFATELAPHLERLMRKNPDSVLPAVAVLLSALDLDLSAHAETLFLPSLLRQLRSAKEDIRDQAVFAMEHLAASCKDPKVLGNVAMELISVLSGKAGVLAQWYQRHCIVVALRSVAAAARALAAQVPNAVAIATALAPLAEKEAHEEARALAYLALAEWTALCVGSDAEVPAEPLKVMTAALKGTKPAAPAIVGAARLVELTPAAAAPVASAMVAALSRRVEDAKARPGAGCQLEPCSSLQLLAQLAATGACADAAAATPWATMKDAASFIYPTLEFEAADPGALAAVCASIAAATRVEAAKGVAGVNGGTPSEAVANAVARCLVHSADTVRRAAMAATAAIVEASPSKGRVALLKALKQVVDELAAAEAAAAAAAIKARAAADEDDAALKKRRATVPSAGRLQAALAAAAGQVSDREHLTQSKDKAAPIAADACAAAAAPLLLLSHHPMVAHSLKGAPAVWRHAVAATGATVETLLVASAAAAVAAAAIADTEATRLAGQWALSTLSLRCGTAGVELVQSQVLPVLLNSLRTSGSGLQSTSTEDLAIARAPAGVLYGTVQAAAGDKEKAKGAGGKATASKNAARRGKDAEEGANGARGGALSPEEQQLLAQEEIIRARVRGMQAQAEASLAALTAAFRGCGRQLGAHALLETPALLRTAGVLASPLLGAEGRRCLYAVAKCLDESVQPLASDVTDATVVLQVMGETAAAASSAMESLLSGLADVLFDRGSAAAVAEGASADLALSAPALALLLPLMGAVLEDPARPADAQTALRVIGAHADVSVWGEEQVEDPLWRACVPDMLHLALMALARYRRLEEPSAADVLAAICVGVDLPLKPETEWPLLLGEEGLLNEEAHIRAASLRAVRMMCMASEDPRELLVRYTVPEAAQDLPQLEPRSASAKAIAAALAAHPQVQNELVSSLLGIYEQHCPPKQEQQGTIGKGSKKQPRFAAAAAEEAEAAALAAVDKGWPSRRGVALALEACASAHSLRGDLGDLFAFLVKDGLADSDELVRAAMLQAGTALINGYGQDGSYLAPCEAAVAAPPLAGEDVRRADWRRQGVVVFLGAAAGHIDPSDPKVVAVAKSLSQALSTPSEAVQMAISDCLAPLCKVRCHCAIARHCNNTDNGMQAAGMPSRPVAILISVWCVGGGGTYGERRGAAMGVAAVVKGLGIGALKREGIMARLEEACSTSSAAGAYQAKEGALFAFECLCMRLGLLFEPYVIVLLPLLLRCFSDTSDKVRDAAQDCARSIMSKLSAHGVKLVLPAILQSLSDPAWRTKQAAIQLLGSMAYCAPKQLSSCLPMIVPRLTEAFADTHPRVREAGKLALEDVGSVIRNPEVASLSSVLMAALCDAKHTKSALEALLACEFMHSIDAPSLALVMPVLVRGLRDRSAEAKRRAALIIGSMSTMAADPKDLVPYLDGIMPGLKATVKDPIPDVRATCAKALGALASGMGEAKLGDLVPWLQDALKGDSSAPERSGAAQALAEVLVALGFERAAGVLMEMLPLSRHPKAHVREGVTWLLCFMPAAMGKGFTPLINRSLPVVIAGLSDEADGVREVAMRAGQVLVKRHGRLHADLLLPSLENGLTDEDWRIRQSSVALLGDLLFLIGDTKEAAAEDGDDIGGSHRASQAIEGALGVGRRNGVLAALYLARSDSSSVVRQKALQVWKTIVPQTPRALREIMPLLISRVVDGLARCARAVRTGIPDDAQRGRLQGCGGSGAIFDQVLSLRSRELLAYLVPRLMARPITAPHSRALRAITQVPIAALHLYLGQIIPVLVAEMADAEARAEKAKAGVSAEEAAYEPDVVAFDELQKVGMNTLCAELTSQLANDSPSRRKWAAHLIELHSKGSIHDFIEQVPMLLRGLLMRLVDTDQSVLVASSKAMLALNARVGPEALVPHLTFACGIISSSISDARHRKGGAGMSFELPGLNIPKGLEPWLPMYQQGLMYGSPEVREAAASGIGQLVEVTAPKYLQPFLIKITGPLIRIVGDRFPSAVKAAILHTLGLLLDKGGPSLKPFVPQLQTTFVKSLSDPGASVRQRGLSALGQLVVLTTRVDPLIAELSQGAASAETPAPVREAMLQALEDVLSKAGARATPAALSQAVTLLAPLLGSPSSVIRGAAGAATGAKSAEAKDENGIALKTAAASSKALGLLTLAVLQEQGEAAAASVFAKSAPALATALDVGSGDGRLSAALALKTVAKAAPALTRPCLSSLAPALVKALKDTTPSVKVAVERAMVHGKPATLAGYLASGDSPDTVRFVRDYARRVLAKLAAESGDEA